MLLPREGQNIRTESPRLRIEPQNRILWNRDVHGNLVVDEASLSLPVECWWLINIVRMRVGGNLRDMLSMQGRRGLRPVETPLPVR